jgi:cytochrome c-type biogenesis protein CcmH/NrfG
MNRDVGASKLELEKRSPDKKGISHWGPGKGVFIVSVLLAFGVGFVLGAIFEHRAIEGGKRTSSPLPSQTTVPAAGQERGLTSEERSALAALEARVNSDPNDADGWIELGNLNYDLGRPAEAIRAYEKALALKPGNPDVLTDMGTMYRALGQPEKAVELFREAHRVDPKHFNSLYNEGVVLLHDLNDVRGAARAWKEFLALVPQGPQSERIKRILETLKEQGRID